MRLFFAMALEPDGIRRLDSLLALSLPALRVCSRLTEPENRHITLLFIGEWPEERLPELIGLLDRMAARHEPFHVTLDCFGIFGSARRGHERRGRRGGRPGEGHQILWLGDSELRRHRGLRNGLDPDRLEMLDLVGDLRQGAVNLGIEPDERPYFPHLTVTRKLPASQADAVLDALPAFASIRIAVTGVTLMQSVPEAGFMVYCPLHIAPLGGASRPDSVTGDTVSSA